VDWVLVTIRENGILPVNNFWSCAGWVHTDGTVTFPQDCGPMVYDAMNEYHVLVQHRNHLGVLSPTEVDVHCGGLILDWDFTASNSYAPVPRFGQKEVEPGVWAMHQGNGHQSGTITSINSVDWTLWRSLQGVYGYQPGDFDMEVRVNSIDDSAWKVNQGKSSGIIFY
jgi:hypothetical protein